MALTTLAENKVYLGIDPSDTSQDVIIEIFREAVEQLILNFCECSFEPVIISGPPGEILDGDRSDVILPRNSPIISVEKVFINVDLDGSNGSELIENEDFYIDDNAIILRFIHTPKGRGLVRVDYTFGFASVPPDVKLAVFQSVKAELQRKNRNTEDISSRSKGDERESYAGVFDTKTGLLKTAIAKIQPYRTYEFPNIGIAQRNT